MVIGGPLAFSLCALLYQHQAVLSWPFRDAGWMEILGSQSHRGDDRFAQDWYNGNNTTEGQPISAPIDGLIVVSEWACTGYGQQIVIFDVDRALAVRLAHLRTRALRVGDHVTAGRTIVGTVGRTGSAPDCAIQALGPEIAHLHLAAYAVSAERELSRPITSVAIGGARSPYALPFRFDRRE